MCDAQATYIPNQDFSGEDVFVYSYLYENLTTTSDGKLQARIIVRPIPDPIMAQSDEITMTTDDGHVHIPVLKNDYSKDGSGVCITTEEKHFSEGKQVLSLILICSKNFSLNKQTWFRAWTRFETEARDV